MTLASARQIVIEHLRWRRGETDVQRHSWRLITEAIATLLEATDAA